MVVIFWPLYPSLNCLLSAPLRKCYYSAQDFVKQFSVPISIVSFLGHLCPMGKGAWGYPYVKHQPRRNNTKESATITHYSFQIVCGFFNVPHWTYKHGRYCEAGPTIYSPYPRRLESLTICWCNYKGSTFYSVILRPWVLVRPELNSWPTA